jgi:DNA-binding response OmpR family regulator
MRDLRANGGFVMDNILTGRSILVVEDEPLIAIDIANAFTQVGARVLAVRSLRDALAAVEDDTLSAAILDHALGDGDSSQLCTRLKERNIPFVLHSGYSQLDGACGDGVQVGKPASPQVLVSAVEELLSTRPVSH